MAPPHAFKADLWEVETGTCIHSYRCPDEYPDFFINPKVLSCAFNADGTRVAGAIEGASVYIWDVATETFERQLRLAGGRKGVGDMQSVAFSPS
jgi:WD40 repeat protein